MKTSISSTQKIPALCALLAATVVPALADGPTFTSDLTIDTTSPEIHFDSSSATTPTTENPSIRVGTTLDRLMISPSERGMAISIPTATGRILFGTSKADPEKSYHFIPPADGSDAAILCDNSNAAATTPRNMFEIRNNGGARFVLHDTSQTEQKKYTFATNPSGNFTMTRAGVAGAEIVVKNDGVIEMGPGTTTSVRITDSGIHALGYLTLSDEATKTDIEEIHHEELLEKLSALPVSTWRFKGDHDSERHIGPMAQDFHNLFNKDDKEATTINLSDMAGVALAGVKSLDQKMTQEIHGMTQKMDQRDEIIATQAATIEQLQKRLEDLEARFEKME